MKFRERQQVKIVGIEAPTRLPAGPLDLGKAQPRLYCADNAARHSILQFEDVIERAIEAVGPDVCAGRRVDQLAGDTHTITRFAY
jgi:hypothetical protein